MYISDVLLPYEITLQVQIKIYSNPLGTLCTDLLKLRQFKLSFFIVNIYKYSHIFVTVY